jgi:uncharacterized membrane protein
MAFLIFLGAGVLILGAVYVFLGIKRRRKAHGLRRDWHPTSAKIVTSRVSSREYADTIQDGPHTSLKKHEPVITFAYQVEDQTYTRTQFGLFPRTRDFAKANAMCDLYPQGREIEIHYNPASPQQAILLRPRKVAQQKARYRPQWRRMSNYPTLIIGIFLTVVGLVQIALGIVLLVS